MSDEKLRILEMIKDGTISPDEGLDLIQALESAERSLVRATPDKEHLDIPECCSDDETSESDPPDGKNRKPQWLFVKVCEGDGKVVNIKVPIGLAKFAGKFIPREAKAEMAGHGIDLDLNGLMKTLEDCGPMNLVEVNEGDGKVVKIYTE